MTKTLPTLTVLLMLAAGCVQAAQPDTDHDGVPDIAEPLLHTDPQNPDTDGDGQNDLVDKEPVIAKSPITASNAPAPFHLGEVLVENNVDPATQSDAPDHLEIQVVNDSAKPLKGFTLYYTITDADSGANEAYIAHPDLTVPTHGTARIQVDDSGKAGHLRANPNSIYVTAQSAKKVEVTLQLPDTEAVSQTVKKDAGGAEKAD